MPEMEICYSKLFASSPCPSNSTKLERNKKSARQ